MFNIFCVKIARYNIEKCVHIDCHTEHDCDKIQTDILDTILFSALDGERESPLIPK